MGGKLGVGADFLEQTRTGKGVRETGFDLLQDNQIKLTLSHSIMHLIKGQDFIEEVGINHGKNHRH
jgi:hypothetical protein